MYQLRGRVGRSHRARVRLLLLPAAARADRGGARAARDDQRAPVARQRVPDRAARPRDPRRRQPARRRAARAHRRGRVRHVLPAPGRSRSRELKGEPLPEEKEIRIDLPVKAFIPPGWVAQEALRLDLYRRISTAGDHDDARSTSGDETDRPLRRAAARGRDAVRGRVAPRDAPPRSGVEEITTYQRAGPHPAGRAGRRAAVRPDRARVRRHVPRREADAEPRAGAGVRRGHGPATSSAGSLEAAGSEPAAGPADRAVDEEPGLPRTLG